MPQMSEFEVAVWTAPLVALLRDMIPGVDGRIMVFIVAFAVASVLSLPHTIEKGPAAIVSGLASALLSALIAMGGVKLVDRAVSKVGSP